MKMKQIIAQLTLLLPLLNLLQTNMAHRFRFQTLWRQMKDLTVHSIHQITEHLLQLRNITLKRERKGRNPTHWSQIQTPIRPQILQHQINTKAMDAEKQTRFNSVIPCRDLHVEEWQMKMDNIICEFKNTNSA
jgi:hypothetical protein